MKSDLSPSDAKEPRADKTETPTSIIKGMLSKSQTFFKPWHRGANPVGDSGDALFQNELNRDEDDGKRSR